MQTIKPINTGKKSSRNNNPNKTALTPRVSKCCMVYGITMVFTTTSDLALKTLVFMSNHGPENFYSVTDIAEQINCSSSYLSKVLNQLVVAGILLSEKGPGKGYKLKNKPAKIKVISVLKTYSQAIKFTICLLSRSECVKDNYCPYHNHYSACMNSLLEGIKKQTIADIAAEGWPGLRT